MNHQPFEDWLLNDQPMNPKQKLELEAHLRVCSYCSALSATGKALHSLKMVSPRAGFAKRFEARLAMQKATERRRRLWGSLLFTFGGLVILMWIAGPYINAFIASPATSLTALIGWGVFLITTLQAVVEAGSVLLRVIPRVLSPFAWMMVLSAFAGFGLLWSVSIWRFFRVPRGV